MNLDAAKATVREIIRLASIRDAQFADAFDRESAERKCNQLVHNSTKALSQLLEAVTNLEKLEAEWREHGGNPTNGYEVAGSIKRLLHPEDK